MRGYISINAARKSKKEKWTKIENQMVQYGWNTALGLQVTGSEDGEEGRRILRQKGKGALEIWNTWASLYTE